ncbi:DHH family phosphoesterase [Lactobacillus sp. DCY120]|uniref:Cyclic-di-AMP phosphodiesterase n=1 Tax=Bombilactobacillus apium TaxID=2675299 RepID=A0A850QXM7_9LACO|nr:DHH family phosphoesterase [Bombilactobacillus apium]NVY96574.1 DHH family phosphoesterase [Bombilactobacillus apium]
MSKKKLTNQNLLALSSAAKLGSAGLLVLLVALILVQFLDRPEDLIFSLSIIVLLVLLSAYLLNDLLKQANQHLYDLSFRENRGQQEALIKLPMGILLYSADKKHKIEWINPRLQRHFGDREILGLTMSQLNPKLEQLVISSSESKAQSQVIQLESAQFRAFVQRDLRIIYLLNITDLVQLQQKYESEKIALGQIFLDNYDEITQTMADREQSNLDNYVTNQLTDWANNNAMFLKRISKDRFIVVAYARSLQQLEENSFGILDQIRKGTSQQNYPLTLSIGLAYGHDNLAQVAEEAQKNLDLALGRGGDQVVVRKGEEPASFYGGNTNPMEKRTRVRARMISQALRDLFDQADHLYVMGHDRPDMDSLGACLGIHRIAQMNDKKCQIVIDQTEVHTDIARLLTLIDQDPTLKDDLISPKKAVETVEKNSLLIMVDVSKPSLSMSPELFQKLAKQTIIIDHHRRGEEFPANPILVYIEPYASSASELVTEMIEYQPKSKQSLSKLEATALLAGISLDTKSFTLRAGTRTFDAASYLRSLGADGTMIQNLLKEDVTAYIQQSHLISTIEMITPHVAVCAGEDDQSYDSVIAAQAADTLLSLSNIQAGFVLTKRDDDVVAISARSLGDFNVQVIMEEMGGGGHLSNAATQLKQTTVSAAKKELIAITQQKVEDIKQ